MIARLLTNISVQRCASLIALVAHVVLVLRVFPLRILLAGEVPLRGDVERYFATVHGTANVGGLYGYDPYNMAGYPVGLWNSMGKKGYEILHLLLPEVPLAQLFYLTIVAVLITCPIVLWCALRKSFATHGERAFVLLLLITYWHLDTQISYFWGFGNIFFPAMSCAAVLMCTTLNRMMTGTRFLWARSLLLGLLATAIFYAHTVVLLAALVPLAAVMCVGRTHEQWRRAIPWVALAVGVFALLSVAWLLPLLATREDCLSKPEQWFQGGPKHLIMDVFSDRVYLQHFDRNFLYHVAVVAGLAGAWMAWRDRRDSLLAGLGLGGVASLVITYGFTYLGSLSSVQPYRFIIPTTLLLLAPAAFAMCRFAKAAAKASRDVKWGAVVLLLILAPEVTAYVIDLAWGRSEIGLGDDRAAVIEEVKRLPGRGRILCDDAGLGHVLPAFADRSVIGGLSSQAFLKHRFAGMDEKGILFGRPADAWDPEALKTYLEMYAVDYAILHTPRWQKQANRIASPLTFVKTVGGQSLYRVGEGSHSYLARGVAEVSFGYDGIQVSNIASPDLLLKFHYADWLRPDNPGVSLHPEPVLDDPVPFIRATVADGVRSFSIRKR